MSHLDPAQATDTSHLVPLQGAVANLRLQVVDRAGDRVSLTTREAELLSYLVQHAGRSVARDELLREVWGYARPGRTRAVDDTMKRLRPKIEADPRHPVHLISVHGVGFRFEAAAPPRPVSVAPATSSDLVGRDALLAEVRAAFDAGARLVTLAGPAGAGKSALARAVGGPGVRWCELADAVGVEVGVEAAERALAETLGLGGGPEPSYNLAGTLRTLAPPLVVLDTFDRFVPHAAETVGAWLEQVPSSRWLVTSRERLGLAGEQVIEVGALAVPDAARLFVRRARAVDPGFAPDSEERSVIEEVVRRLDGLPLAIELAAARVRVLRPGSLLRRLDDRLRLLGQRGTGRHDTLEAAVAWSWDLLDDDERSAFAQCAAFGDGFSLEAAEGVVELPSGAWVLDVLQRLRDKSLVRACCHDGELRFSLFETLRLFATRALGDEPAVRARHARWYASWAAGVARDLGRPSGDRAADLLELERVNLSAAHRWLVEHDLDLAVQLANHLDRGLLHRGDHARLVEIADRTLQALGDEAGPAHRAVLLRIRGQNRFVRGRADAAVCDLEQAVAVGAAGATGVRSRLALAAARVEQRRFEAARELLEQAAAVLRDLDEPVLDAAVLASRARTWLIEGLHDEALRAYSTALRAVRRTGDRREEALVLGNLGALHLDHGHLVDALDRLRGAVGLQRERTGASASIACFNLGLALLITDDEAGAIAHWGRGLRAARKAGFRMGEGLARLGLGVALRGDEAVEHLAAAIRVFDEVGAAPWSAYARTHWAAIACLARRPGAVAGLQQALAELTELGSPVREDTAALCDGWMAIARGDLDAARAALPDAVEGRVDAGSGAPCLHALMLRRALPRSRSGSARAAGAGSAMLIPCSGST